MALVRTLLPTIGQNEVISAFSSKKILIVSSILSCLNLIYSLILQSKLILKYQTWEMSCDEEIFFFDKGPWSCWTLRSSHSELLSGCSDVCVQSKRGRAKNVVCSFCDANVTGCSSTQMYADIVGRNVVGQKKACVTILRKDDIWNAQFKTAQQLLNKDIMTTESKPSSSWANQTFLDSTFPANCVWRTNSKLSHCYIHLWELIVIWYCWFAEFGSFGWPMHWIQSTASGAQI